MRRFRDPDEKVDETFRNDYKRFWRFRGVNREWQARYFRLLQNIKRNGAQPDWEEICDKTPGTRQDSPSIEFSFATKLAHMVDPTRPIYDGNVRALYLLKEPNGNVNYCHEVYNFLVTEYARVKGDHLLDESLNRFRQELNPGTSFTDEKIIDSLIWVFVKWAGPAFLEGKHRYE